MTASKQELEKKVEAWRSQCETLSAQIRGKDKELSAEVFSRTWSPIQLKFRAIKSFCLWWGLATLSIFIPVAHFFLVPIFVICGLTFPFAVYNKSTQIMGGIGTCPYCDQLFEIAPASNRWPLNDICESCHRHVQIVK